MVGGEEMTLIKIISGQPVGYDTGVLSARRLLVIEALRRSNGNMLRASKILRVKRSRLYAICSEIGVNAYDFRRRDRTSDDPPPLR